MLPRDAPEGHASGLDPDRILIWGDSATLGYGVGSHDLALPGCLARRISAVTGRGADVAAWPIAHLPIRSAESTLQASRFASYDAIVIFIGTWDAAHRTPTEMWERRLRSFIAAVTAACSATTRVVVTGVSVSEVNPTGRSVLGARAERHAHRMNAATEAVCREFRRVSFLPIPPGRDTTLPGVRSSSGYRELADTVSAHLTPLLARGPTPILHGRRSGSAREIRNRTQNETARQRAVDELQLRLLQGSPALARITAHARAVFGAQSAYVTVIDRDVQWFASGADDDPQLATERASAFCDHTIRRAEPMIVADATKDPRFANNPFVVPSGGVRFYAGFPIESADGHRIGALCVTDPSPRTGDDVSPRALRDLALLVQRELRVHSASLAL